MINPPGAGAALKTDGAVMSRLGIETSVIRQHLKTL